MLLLLQFDVFVTCWTDFISLIQLMVLSFFCLLGTTCATVLTRAIFAEGCKSVAAGMNAMDLRRGITMAVDSVVTNLKSRARMISTSEEIAQVSWPFLNLHIKVTAFFFLGTYNSLSFAGNLLGKKI